MTASLSMYPSSMSWVSRTFFQILKVMLKWCSIWWIHTPRTDILIGNTFGQFLTLFTRSMSPKRLLTQIVPGLLPKERLTSERLLRSTRNGGRISIVFHSCRVSIFKYLTPAGSKGRCLHLLKSTTAPVPKQKPRRKIAVLPVPPKSTGTNSQSNLVPTIAPRPGYGTGNNDAAEEEVKLNL